MEARRLSKSAGGYADAQFTDPRDPMVQQAYIVYVCVYIYIYIYLHGPARPDGAAGRGKEIELVSTSSLGCISKMSDASRHITSR